MIARLSKLITKYAEGRAAKPTQVAKELRAIADWLAGEPPPAQSPVTKTTDQERQVFEHWQKRMGKPRSQLTPERRSKIRARLKSYSVQDILRAIDNVADSPWHRGENEHGKEYVDLGLILRNGEKLESYRDMDGTSQTETPSEDRTEQILTELYAESERQLKEGEVDAYNLTQEKIRLAKQARSLGKRTRQAGQRD